jgi:hypothetical protein
MQNILDKSEMEYSSNEDICADLFRRGPKIKRASNTSTWEREIRIDREKSDREGENLLPLSFIMQPLKVGVTPIGRKYELQLAKIAWVYINNPQLFLSFCFFSIFHAF